MDKQTRQLRETTRRHFFQNCGLGLGQIALGSLLANSMPSKSAAADVRIRAAKAHESPFAPRPTHFPAKAKRVIYLFMAGAPSQLELFDYKPKLKELEGKPLPPSVIKGQRYAFIQPDAAVLGPRFDFKQYGQSGQWISTAFPKLAEICDTV